MWWREDNFREKKDSLEMRYKLIREIRSFFDDHDFIEVETPALQASPGMEAHIHAFRTQILTPYLENRGYLYLHTSPEFAMKKLLVAGMPRIFQICKCFRNAESSFLHSCEFTMIEWYRAGAGYEDIMRDCVDLLRRCANALQIEFYRHKDNIADPFQQWQKLTVCEAFENYAGIDIIPVLDDLKGFTRLANKIGISTDDNDLWEDVFFRIFLEKIEPNLGQGTPAILYDYPVSMAALSRPKPADSRFAERFEIYICGLELANAFGELTDPEEQKKRFIKDMELKKNLYGQNWPVDEDFIKALEHGMPESGGIALGIDRLAMLAAGAEKIEDVLWTPKP